MGRLPERRSSLSVRREGRVVRTFAVREHHMCGIHVPSAIQIINFVDGGFFQPREITIAFSLE